MAIHPMISQERDIRYFHSVSPGTFNIPIHSHNVNEIFLCISDNINYYVEGNIYELEKHDIIITNTEELHRPILRTTDIYERKIIQFKPEYLALLPMEDINPMHTYELRETGKNNIIHASETLENNLIYYFYEINKYYNKESSDIMLKTLLLQLVIKINDILNKPKISKKTSKSDPKVIAVQNYIDNHIDTLITLDLLSNKFFIDKYYLCHLFKKHKGITIMEYIHIKRIEKAKSLLLEGIPVIQVCYLIGFNDYSNFYKKFKKIVGMAPKKYIEKYTHISKSSL
ncbi:MAG: AraC family transcriptional regulator [Vallitalea sp.]|jgi:YesN/AraC family two-component response regulator|nr:AraC family transcriptional regulator [Vallitalea sp.]